MVLGRRTPKTWPRRAQDFLWPRMGWMRTARYYWVRFRRLRGHPDPIARGAALGACVCFTPLPGAHFLLAVLLAWVCRGNILAAMIACWIGNPWTYPMMWSVSYKTGGLLYQTMGWPLEHSVQAESWSHFWAQMAHDPWGLMVPWVMGGILMMVLTLPIVYAATYLLVLQGRRR